MSNIQLEHLQLDTRMEEFSGGLFLKEKYYPENLTNVCVYTYVSSDQIWYGVNLGARRILMYKTLLALTTDLAHLIENCTDAYDSVEPASLQSGGMESAYISLTPACWEQLHQE